MEIEKSDIEWLIMLLIMILQQSPLKINIIGRKKKPRKKRRRDKHNR